jgi:hypothetical protein
VTLPTRDAVFALPVGAARKNAYCPFSVASDAVALIVTEAFVFLKASVTDVAVIVTLPPAGTDPGAV